MGKNSNDIKYSVEFELTCYAAPEQYDVFLLNGNERALIGYVRERHDHITAYYIPNEHTPNERELVFELEDDSFDNKRISLLRKIKTALLKAHSKFDSRFSISKLKNEILDNINVTHKYNFASPYGFMIEDICKRLFNDFEKYMPQDEHKPTNESLLSQTEAVLRFIDNRFNFKKRKRKSKEYLYLAYCISEHHFRIIKNQVNVGDLFLDEVLINLDHNNMLFVHSLDTCEVKNLVDRIVLKCKLLQMAEEV
jgi:hypothetical protein